MDRFRPLVLQKQTSAIQISSRLASLHSSCLPHFQRSSLAIFHRDNPAYSSDACALLCSRLLCCSLSVCFSALRTFCPALLLFFSSLLTQQPNLSPSSTFISLDSLFFPQPSIDLLPASRPASVCQAGSPSPALMDFVIYGQERNP